MLSSNEPFNTAGNGLNLSPSVLFCSPSQPKYHANDEPYEENSAQATGFYPEDYTFLAHDMIFRVDVIASHVDAN